MLRQCYCSAGSGCSVPPLGCEGVVFQCEQLYKEAVPEGHKAVGNITFHKLWQQLVPNLVITKPGTDICWESHQNNTAIYRNSNLPEVVKSAKLKKQQQQLAIVGV